MEDILFDLNEEQRKAVFSSSKRNLVIAGPGSGKTKVLTRKIAYLVKNGADPKKIVSLTFTNKAAREIKDRALQLEENCKESYLGTFHSFGAYFLRITLSKFSIFGLKPDFTIVDEDDLKKIAKNVLNFLKVDSSAKNIAWFLMIFERVKSNLSFSDEEILNDISFFIPDWKKTEKEISFQFAKKMYEETWKLNLVDFTDLLALPVKIMSENHEIKRFWQKSFPFFLVDEWQDTNFLQYQFFRHFVESSDSFFFLVGDPDQSIYSWRGAEVENLFRLKRDFPDTKVFKLTRNYRSSDNILKIANAVLKNKSFEEREIVGVKGEGEDVRFLNFKTQEEESEEISRIIKDLNLKDVKFSEMAIFYRTNAQSRAFEESFLKLGIPYKIVKGMKFFERAEVKTLISYLRFIQNKNDNLSFERIIESGKFGIGKKTLSELLIFGNGAYSRSFGEIDKLPSKTKSKLESFKKLIGEVERCSKELLLSDLIWKIYETFNLEDYLWSLSSDKEEFESRKENVAELSFFAKKFDEFENPIEKFLENVSLLSSEDLVEESESVSLMSYHSSKGLEFKAVFLVGTNENLIPHKQSVEEGNLDEERRLFYVGITRAKEYLFISWFSEGNFSFFRPSRFLFEIGALDEEDEFDLEESNIARKFYQRQKREFLEKRLKEKEILKELQNFLDKPKDFSEENKSLKIGDKVKHEIFGFGTISNISNGIATIKFHSTTRMISLKFGKLKKCE